MGLITPSYGQGTFEESPFVDMIFKIDTSVYTWEEDAMMINGEMQLPFYYGSENEIAEVEMKLAGYADAAAIQLKVSNDYILVDSLLIIDDYLRFKVKFKDLTSSNFLKFVFKDQMDSAKTQFYDLGLFPHTQTSLQIVSSGSEFFIGEEQIIDIAVSNIHNVKINNQWVNEDKANYLIRKYNDQLRVHFLPKKKGLYTWKVRIPLRKPEIVGETMVFESAPLIKRFEIKSGRIAFLNINQLEITPAEDNQSPNIIQIDNNARLSLEKTYRIEDQEAPGGALIAELYTQSSLSNGKVLATLRTYAYHQKSKGYLYLKQNDKALFVTNFDITPRTKIESIYIQRPGKNWEKTQKIFPGEKINIRLEGQGLHKGKFTFEGTYQQQYDSLLKNENDIQFRIEVPIDILSNTVEIYNYSSSTGLKLNVNEYQKPKELDFVILDVDGSDYPVNTLDKPIYYEKTITDLVIKFDENRIDFSNKLFGKQFLEIDIKIKNKAGNIIELYEFEDIIVCPGTFSPRGDRYDKSDCTANTINLNNFIKNKTSQLPVYDFIADDDVQHELWILSDSEDIDFVETAFQDVPFLYVADGHHRTAAAARIGQKRKEGNISHNGKEEYNYFLAVLFPDKELKIFDYNRVVRDLNGLSPEQFLAGLESSFTVSKLTGQNPKPNRIREFSVYLNGDWYQLIAKDGSWNENDPVGDLDVTILSEKVLSPLLNIVDLRKDDRIDFVGGIRGLAELERRVDSGEMAAAFALYPVSMDQLLTIADANEIMPPKTTWFEPKLRSGLFIHDLE